MLVLTRKLGERVMIGNGIVVTVIDVSGDRVKVGFDCPAHIPVPREEVYRRIRANPPAEVSVGSPDESPYYPEFA